MPEVVNKKIVNMSQRLLIVVASVLFLSGCSNAQKVDTQTTNNADYQKTSTSLSRETIRASSNEDFIDLDKICQCEKKFKQEYFIEWSGQVISGFSSGAELGVRRFDQSGKYKQFFVFANGLYNGETGDNVRVKGRMTGITCAYFNTVFGECVPEIEADSIEILK